MKQPQPERLCLLLQTHAHRPLPAGLYWARDRPQLVLRWGGYQILLHFHQLSLSERYFCRPTLEIRLLNYGFSQGPHHSGLLSYSCSIKVSHCNYWSFTWPNIYPQQSQNALSFVFSSAHLSLLPLISWLNLCLLWVQMQNQFQRGQPGSVARPDPEQSGLLIIMQATWFSYSDNHNLDIPSARCSVWEPIIRLEMWTRGSYWTKITKTHSFTWFKAYFQPKKWMLE